MDSFREIKKGSQLMMTRSNFFSSARHSLILILFFVGGCQGTNPVEMVVGGVKGEASKWVNIFQGTTGEEKKIIATSKPKIVPPKPPAWTDKWVCRMASTSVKSISPAWDISQSGYKKYIDEAKKRGMSPEACASVLGRSHSKKSASKSKIHLYLVFHFRILKCQ